MIIHYLAFADEAEAIRHLPNHWFEVDWRRDIIGGPFPGLEGYVIAMMLPVLNRSLPGLIAAGYYATANHFTFVYGTAPQRLV